MNLAERNELIKASPAIQVQSKMTLLQRQCMECPTCKCLRRLTQYRHLSRQRYRISSETRFQQQERELLKRNIRSTR